MELLQAGVGNLAYFQKFLPVAFIKSEIAAAPWQSARGRISPARRFPDREKFAEKLNNASLYEDILTGCAFSGDIHWRFLNTQAFEKIAPRQLTHFIYCTATRRHGRI